MLPRIFKGLRERYENWRAWSRAANELYALDDRSLADIGISRSDIPYLLSGRPLSANDPRGTGRPASTLRHAA